MMDADQKVERLGRFTLKQTSYGRLSILAP
jgi:hypothetical protein